jgi:nucleotide-binding universal stress UspA family protein
VSAASQPARRAPAALLDTLVRPLRSIVAIVDFSPKSDNAVARAALLAREHGASLHLLHVVAPRRFATASLWTPERDDLPVRIERACRALATLAARTATTHGVEASCKVRSGDTLQAILEESRAADLVVVAAKRSNPLRDVVLRTPTERLLRLLQRPMLVVKRAALGSYRGTLVPTAGTSRGGFLVEPTHSAGHVEDGDELVVVPKDGHASMGTFLLGTLAQRLVAHASCDVLVLPKAVASAGRKHAHDVRERALAFDGKHRARPKPAA